MASFEFSMDLSEFENIEKNLDKAIQKGLKAGADVMYSGVKSALLSAIGSKRNPNNKHISTGGLMGALGISAVLSDGLGNQNIKIGFSGDKNSHGEPYSKIANILEYGSSKTGKQNRPARPFMAVAKNKYKKQVEQAIKDTIESEL